MDLRIPSFHLTFSKGLPTRGDLAKHPAYIVLHWLQASQFSGSVTFQRDARFKQLFVTEGDIVATRSNLVPEGLDLLLARKFMPSTEVALLQPPRENESDGDWDAEFMQNLRKKDTLPRETLEEARKLMIEGRLLNLLGWFEGEYELYKGEKRPDFLEPVDPYVPYPLEAFLDRIEMFVLSGRVNFPQQLIADLPNESEIQKHGGAALLLSFAEKRATGQLMFARGRRRKLIRCAAGNIETVATTEPTETLGAILNRWDYLSQDEIDQVDKECQKTGKRMRDVIRTNEVLPETLLQQALATLHAERILESFSWRSGKYEFKGTFEAPPPTKDFTLPPAVERKEPEADQTEAFPSDVLHLADELFEMLTPDDRGVILYGAPASEELFHLLEGVGAVWRARGYSTLVINESEHEIPDLLELETYSRLLCLSPPRSAPPIQHCKNVVAIQKGITEKNRMDDLVSGLSPVALDGFVFVER